MISFNSMKIALKYFIILLSNALTLYITGHSIQLFTSAMAHRPDTHTPFPLPHTQTQFSPFWVLVEYRCWAFFRQQCKCMLSCFGSNTHYEVKHSACMRALVFEDGIIAGLNLRDWDQQIRCVWNEVKRTSRLLLSFFLCQKVRSSAKWFVVKNLCRKYNWILFDNGQK